MKTILRTLTIILVSPIAFIVVLMKRGTYSRRLINTISDYFTNRAKTKQALADSRNKYVQAKVLDKLYCNEVNIYPKIFLGRVSGYYKDGRIVASTKNVGLMLADTLFHEDRHYQQDTKNLIDEDTYIQHDQDLLGYLTQHIEKDARRYAYVQVCKHFPDDPKIKRYKLFFHPWKGIVPKVNKLEGKLRDLFKQVTQRG